MIRKLEHERDKLSTQLEKVQEGASQAKKVAKENESQAGAAADKCKQLEGQGWRIFFSFRKCSKSRVLGIFVTENI